MTAGATTYDNFRGASRSTSQRNTQVHCELAQRIHMERQMEIQRRLAQGRPAPVRRTFAIRRRIGRGLIQLGSVLASDGPLQPRAGA
jgi:hypothetical protein